METDEPPDYDGRLIRRLRPPEVEGAAGEWDSRWVLRLRSPFDQPTLTKLAAAVTALLAEGHVHLTTLETDRARLRLHTTVHPLDPEAYPLIDTVLQAIDTHLGIVEINDSPREFWRTFRNA